jgi:hypothetical protein
MIYEYAPGKGTSFVTHYHRNVERPEQDPFALLGVCQQTYQGVRLLPHIAHTISTRTLPYLHRWIDTRPLYQRRAIMTIKIRFIRSQIYWRAYASPSGNKNLWFPECTGLKRVIVGIGAAFQKEEETEFLGRVRDEIVWANLGVEVTVAHQPLFSID